MQYGFFGNLEVISKTGVKVLTKYLDECHASKHLQCSPPPHSNSTAKKGMKKAAAPAAPAPKKAMKKAMKAKAMNA